MDGIRPFELLSDLPPGGHARAALLEWTGQGYVKSNTEIEVHEFVNQHGRTGDRGYAYRSPESGCWEVLSGLFEQNTGWHVP